MHTEKKPHDRKVPSRSGPKPSRLIEEVPLLPKRFFTFPQEGIAMFWLRDDPKKPVRGTPPIK